MGDQVLVRCHCGQFSETTQLQDSIPVENIFCHCNICRHVTGALTFSGLRLVAPPIEAFKTKLTRYATTEKVIRYFCSTCGTHVGYYVPQEDRWRVCSGAVDQVVGDNKGGLESITSHEFVGDTQDGGLMPCFPRTGVYMEDYGGELASNWGNGFATTQEEGAIKQPAKTLQAACHCGQVKFSLERPEER